MKYLIVGYGRSGKAAEALLKDNNDVTVWDKKSGEPEPDVSLFDEVILSPGVPLEQEWLRGGKLSGELELAYENCRGEFIAITGTNGKTTVTTLVGEMVKAAGRDCRVVGNIGNPATEVCKEAGEDTLMVTEVSSFQLETIKTFKPHVAAILNVTPDHLDRHGTFENYASIKARITENQNQDDYFVYNIEDDSCIEIAERSLAIDTPFSADRILPFGAFIEDGFITVKDDAEEVKLCKPEELIIPGRHNLENALAAAAIAYFAGIPSEVIAKTLKSFKGVEHRMEFVRELRGVRYVNDSKGTNPDASMKAIDATYTPIILIAGGYEKNSDFHDFINGFDGRVKELLLLGHTAERFKAAAIECGFDPNHIRICSDMKECIQDASLLAKAGDTVLLSPASASWGMYNNFEERGEDFKNLVNALV